MKILALFFILLSQISCADTQVRMFKKYKDVDAQFKPYIQEFINISNGKVNESHFKNFTMGFRTYEENSDTIGTCHYSVNEVDINEKWWVSNFSQLNRMELVFHEFGHCILKRGHTEEPTRKGFVAWLERAGFKLGIFIKKGYLSDGCPASLMHPTIVGERCFARHFYYYLNELFAHKPTNYVEIRSANRKECKEPEVRNRTPDWTDMDEKTLQRSKKRCKELYSTCLKVFIKNSSDSYAAICE